jgi:cytochrome P450
MKGDITTKMHELHRIYGPVVRCAPNELTFITAQAWKDIYTSRKGNEAFPQNNVLGVHDKEYFGALSMLWQTDNVEHDRQRRIMAPFFSEKSLRDQEPIFAKYTDLLVQRMHEHAGLPVDLVAWFHFATFDIIGDLAFGEPFDCLEKSEVHPWIDFIFSRIRIMQYGQIIMAMGRLGAIIKMMVPRRVVNEIVDHVNITKAKVDKRRGLKTDRSDFMTAILAHVGKESGMSVGELYANTQTLVMAGSETSATVLAVVAFSLMAHPDKLRKLRRELDDAFAADREITFTSVAGLPYLNAVISESLRILPPVPAGIHRFVPAGGGFVDGRWVAGGTDVHVPHFAASRSPSNFRDPDSFVPERWMGDERYARDNHNAYQPFSLGPRNCMGRGLALMEIRFTIARMVWNFDFEMMPESRDWDKMKTFLLYEKPPLYARLTPLRPALTKRPSGEFAKSVKVVTLGRIERNI